MTFLQSSSRLSLSDFAKTHKVRSFDLWLPFHLAATAHSRPDDPIVVRDSTALALLQGEDKPLVYRRADIATALGLDTLDAPETLLSLTCVPESCELYVRWDRPGRKMIPANTRILHRVVTEEDALQQGIVASRRVETRGRKRAASVSSAVTDAGSLAHAELTLSKKRADRAASRADLERRLGDELPSREHSDLEQLRIHTLHTIQKVKRQPPLHLFANPSHAVVLSASGSHWRRTDPRVIFHTFRRQGATGPQAVSRQLVLLFLDDVLVQLFQLKPKPTQTEKLARRRAALGGILSQYAKRGYAVCFVDHLPSLHHASKDEFFRITAIIEDLCVSHCGELDVTVMLSVLSNVSASIGANSSFVLPHCTGLLHFLTAEVNQSLQPDPATSLVVGTTDRESPFTASYHAQFASSAHMAFTEIDDFLKLDSS